MLNATDLRVGMVIKFEGAIYSILTVMHITPGNWRAMVQVKMRNIETGSAMEKRFSSGDKFDQAYIEQKETEYSYREGDNYIFMDQENYEQLPISKEVLGDAVLYLKENMPVKINYCEGKIVGIQLPFVVELKIVETEPALKGATVTNVYKTAKLETGATVTVPPFIANGEIIRVDTRDGKYVERASK